MNYSFKLTGRRTGLMIFVLFLILFGTINVSTVNAYEGKRPAPEKWNPKTDLSVAHVHDVRVSPDSSRVVWTEGRFIMNDTESRMLTHIFISNIDGSGRIQLTRGKASCMSPRWSPDGKYISFLSPRDGKLNLWLIRPDGGEAWPVSSVKTAIFDYKWSPDGKKIAYISPPGQTEEEQKAQKSRNDYVIYSRSFKNSILYLLTFGENMDDPAEVEALTKGKENVGNVGGLPSLDWSPDSSRIAFAHTKDSHPGGWLNSDISTVDIVTGKITPLVNTGSAEFAPLYSPDGSQIAFCKSVNPPRWFVEHYVNVIPAKGGKPTALAPTFDAAPNLLCWSLDGKGIYYDEDRRTGHVLAYIPSDGSLSIDIYDTKGEGIFKEFSINRNQKKAGFVYIAPTFPPEAMVSDFPKVNGRMVSRANVTVPISLLPKNQLVRWKSSDGLEIEGILVLPRDYQEGKKYPLVLMIHGGPPYKFSRALSGGVGISPASLAAEGFAVLTANPRGSTGYGIKFRRDVKIWGRMDFKDQMRGVDHIIKMGIADPNRLAVTGWSYGGFMTNWIISHTDRFDAAAVGAGPFDLVSMAGTNDVIGFIPDYFGSEYWQNYDIYLKRSPSYYVQKVKTPTLIMQGEEDPRVPPTQSFELYNALKKRGIVTELVLYPRSGHSPTEPKFLLDLNQRTINWFKRFVK